jgi:polar amino acid transport system substrate-binding protein
VLNDYTTAAFLATDPKTRAFYQLSSDTQYEPGPYGIAVAKDRSGLRDAIRDAVDRIIRSGDYQEVLRRWAVAAGAVQSASINAGGTGT